MKKKVSSVALSIMVFFVACGAPPKEEQEFYKNSVLLKEQIESIREDEETSSKRYNAV